MSTMHDVSTADAIMIAMQAIISFVMIPVVIIIWKNHSRGVNHNRTLYGNGQKGLCGDVESHGKTLAEIKQKCAVHDAMTGSDSDSTNSKEKIAKLVRDVVTIYERQKRGTATEAGGG